MKKYRPILPFLYVATSAISAYIAFSGDKIDYPRLGIAIIFAVIGFDYFRRRR